MGAPFPLVWLFGGFALLFGSKTLAGGALSRDAPVPKADTAVAQLPAPVAAPARLPGRDIRIAKEPDGLFYLFAKVNGVRVRFLVDTGANLVVLTPEDARRAGVGLDGSPAADSIETAAGRSRMDRVTLDRVAVAGRNLDYIDAAVMRGGPGVSLMGQNLLSQLGPITISANEMSLRKIS